MTDRLTLNTEPHTTWSRYGTREVSCGTWEGGSMTFCSACEAYYEQEYPQGYVGYPGDVCVHGKYTGGSGYDLMCHYCEMGETEWVDDPLYQLMFRLGPTSGAHKVATVPMWRLSTIESDDDPTARVRDYMSDMIVKLLDASGNDVEGVRTLLNSMEHYVAKVESGYWKEPEYDRSQL